MLGPIKEGTDLSFMDKHLLNPALIGKSREAVLGKMTSTPQKVRIVLLWYRGNFFNFNH